MRYRIIDLFAGIGGTRLGFEKAGCISVFSSEWDEASKKTYASFFGETPHGDITKAETKAAIKPFDILVAGFPCQPFSSIGKREGFTHSTQGTLFHDIVEILKKHKPAAFLLENVKGLKSHDGGNTYRVIRSALDKIGPNLGYWINDKVLNAADYGTPQKRERIYIVGFRKNLCDASTEVEAGTQI